MTYSVVIPAYNEARRIRRVIDVARRAPGAREVIVVDDGSGDATARMAAAGGARVIRLPENRGKGAAMVAGVQVANSEVVAFLDADLLGLTPHMVTQLVTPVTQGEAEMTIGVFDSGRTATDLAQMLAPNLSGQRAMRAKTFLSIPGVAETRYGVEVAMSNYAKEEGLRVVKVSLPGVTQVMKEEKLGFWRGFMMRLRMYWEIVRTLRLL
jgi:glycosyltransferase involved in cell wall biosynthesis